MEIANEYKKNIYRALVTFLIIVTAYFGVKIVSEIRSYSDFSDKTERTISLSGHGEVKAVPDIANIYFTISKDAKTVKEAQALVAEVEKSSLNLLKTENKILDKDIKTSNASFYPKYEYRYSRPCPTYNCPANNIIIGYTASESITVKVRNTDDVGKIMQGLGTLGVTDLSGPNFSIDNEDQLKADARKKAIDDAKEKAETLAKDLGIRLGKITSFTDSGNYPTPPMMYSAKAEALDNRATGSAELPKGENTISSDVTITFEIK